MLFVDTIEPKIICKQQKENLRRDPDYWSRRRAWWRAHKGELGTDWGSINRLQVEVASFLAGVRRRRAA